MSKELKIERIKCALQNYRWNKGDVFKRDEQGESFGPFGMLLRDVGIPIQEFAAQNSNSQILSLVRKHQTRLEDVYGLSDVTDFQLITTAGDCATSANDMVYKVTEALLGNLSVFPPLLHYYVNSIVKHREEFGAFSDMETTDFSFLYSSIFAEPIPGRNDASENCKLVRVQAGLTWDVATKERIYSCPETSTYDFVSDATCLVLENRTNGKRLPFRVEDVKSLNPNSDFLSAIPSRFRGRLTRYTKAAKNISGILDQDCSYRFYFLSKEPWPDWMQKLTTSVPQPEWEAILSICLEPKRFFEWPKNVCLLWEGCIRTETDGQYRYPAEVKNRLAKLGIDADTRTNGPAIAAFLAAGGKRPLCGSHGWHIHHIYDRTGAVDGIPVTVPHAVREGIYFTQAAGLVAAHPVAHFLAHQSNLLKWLLRREAFVRFGFDPMRVFINP